MAKRITWTVIAGLFAFAIVGNWFMAGSDTMVLRELSDGAGVVVFQRTSDGGRTSRTFEDGTKCTYIDGPTYHDLGFDKPVGYYKLNCNNYVGYASKAWVKQWP